MVSKKNILVMIFVVECFALQSLVIDSVKVQKIKLENELKLFQVSVFCGIFNQSDSVLSIDPIRNTNDIGNTIITLWNNDSELSEYGLWSTPPPRQNLNKQKVAPNERLYGIIHNYYPSLQPGRYVLQLMYDCEIYNNINKNCSELVSGKYEFIFNGHEVKKINSK